MAVAEAPQRAVAQQPPEPLVAIHISELTQALEIMPAVDPTPAGTWTTGNQWWYTSWRYFVAHESLKEALRSDGTPFVELSDSDIAAGKLRNPDGSPRYPILISLASEAIDDNEISPLRDYVSAGGFVLAGSSAYTRNPDGTQRGDFALAAEIGLHMANASLIEANNWNWYDNRHFTKSADHWLTSHIPTGTLDWNGPLGSDQTPYPWDHIAPNSHAGHSLHYAWKVTGGGATVIATGDAGPLLTVRNHGLGQFIYHGAMQPLIGHGGFDPGIYAYLIYRKAIEWAFESFRLPIVRVSPWPYQYDAAFMVRHDFENIQSYIQSIESSAQFEHALGARGDYYFSTGALREDMGGDAATVASLRRAVSDYGATIGSHNGGLRNPQQTSLLPADFDYWHWGPDEALESTPQGYANGKEYAAASILMSFNNIEGWLTGLDNGRYGCAAAGNCPRIWVSPYFNSTREDSRYLLEQSGVVTTGEQKIGPFPSRTLSYKRAAKYFSPITLPISDWFVGTTIAQTTEHHTMDSIRAGVDFYYNLGALINFYTHRPSNNGSVQQEYVTYGMAKSRLWPANAVGINDWWRLRSNVVIAPAVNTADNTYVVTTAVSGATDASTAIEIALPQIKGQAIENMTVLLDGAPATPADYRTTSNGVKVRVGTAVANIEVRYSQQVQNLPPSAANDTYSVRANSFLDQAAPGLLANDNDPEGKILSARLASGPAHGTLTLNTNGSFTYTPALNYVGSDSFTYMANDGAADSNVAMVTITVTSTSNVLFADDFTRTAGALDPLFPWVNALGTWKVTDGVLRGSGGASSYSNAYVATSPLWSNYTLEGRIKFPAGAFGGGIGGRLNPANGAHYGAWVYPDGSVGGSNILRLVKFRDWTTWSWTPMKQVSLPSVGTGWHALKIVFNSSRIQVYYDGTLMIDVTDNNFDSRAAYLTGGISGDMWTYTSPYSVELDNIVVRTLTSTVPLVAANDTYSTNANRTLTQSLPGVLANDTAPEGATQAQLVSGPSNGTLTLNSNGSFTYAPMTNYVGSDSFTYKATDGVSSSNEATVTITVQNMPPVVVDDSYSTDANTNLNQAAPGVLNNDTDPEGSTLTAQLVSGPTNGTLTLNANGSFTYTPMANYVGNDSFTYQTSDGALNSGVATVTITIIHVNQAPLAGNDSYTTNQNTAVTVAVPGILGNDTDPEGATLTAQLVNGPSHGTLTLNAEGSFTYTPTTNYSGSDSFTYKASDGATSSNEATVTITVQNMPPVAVNDSYSTDANTALNQAEPGVLNNDTDPEGSTLTAQLVSGPTNGTLTLNANGSFDFTPAESFAGSDSFTYMVHDGTNSSPAATVTITILPTVTSQVLSR